MTSPLFQLVLVILLVLAPVFVHASAKPRHCNEIHHLDQTRPSGVYTIYPIGATSGILVCFILSCTLTIYVYFIWVAPFIQ